MGNTGVTKIGVVERGKLQRYEALEDRKRLRQQALQGAGWGRGVASNHRKEAQS